MDKDFLNIFLYTVRTAGFRMESQATQHLGRQNSTPKVTRGLNNADPDMSRRTSFPQAGRTCNPEAYPKHRVSEIEDEA